MALRLTCLASAMVALSAGATAAAQTPQQPSPPAPAAAQEPAGGETVILKADVLHEDRQNFILTAEGHVEVRVGDRALKADRLIYDQNNQTMRAQGNVQITDATGTVQFADEIEVDEEFSNGFATRFSTRLGGYSVATAASAIREEGTRNTLEQVVYTGCPVCEEEGSTPTWSLRARRAIQNTETQMISYQDAVLAIKGVPIVYIPWFAHPDPTSEARSGLLAPDLGVSSKLGPFYEQPYLWVISPYSDMTISPMISTNVNPLVKVDYRKRFFSGFVDIESSITHEQDFNSDGDKFGDETWRSHLYGMGLFNINKDWQWGFGVERQSDDLYDQRYDIDGEDDLRGLVASQPRQLLSQLYATGQHSDFYFEAASFVFQGLRDGDDDAEFPKVAPSLFTQKVFDLGDHGLATAELSAVGLFRDAVESLPSGEPGPGDDQPTLNTARATANAVWQAQYVFGPGLVLSPYVQARGDYYSIDDGATGGADTLARALGVAGAQVSYPFIRRGEAVDVIVEPIAMVALATDKANNDGVPNEDSLLFEADESNILSPVAIATYDLWEGGGRAALGLSAAAHVGKDVDVSALVARRWREDEDFAFNDLSNLRDETSDYIASVRADVGAIFSAGARFRMDDAFEVNRIDLDASANVWRIRGGARYFKISENTIGEEDEGLVWNGEFRVTDRWSAVFNQARNISEREDIQLQLGLAYRDECSYFALLYERQGGRDRTLGPSEAIRFQFVLTGLGGVSDMDAD